MLGFTAWWSGRVAGAPQPTLVMNSSGSSEARLERELIERLDHVVFLERRYRASSGRFTQLLARTGMEATEKFSDRYEIQVTEASETKLIVTAFTEREGKKVDLASIDQDFKLHTLTGALEPGEEYLRNLALRQNFDAPLALASDSFSPARSPASQAPLEVEAISTDP